MGNPTTRTHARHTCTWRMIRGIFVGLALLLACSSWATPARAANKVNALPTVKDFTAARFDTLVTVSANGVTDFVFGSGAVQLPGKMQAWLGTNHTGVRTGVVQIDSVLYLNDGSGWKRSDNGLMGGLQAMPVSEQLAAMAKIADGIYLIGPATVSGQPTTQYQIQISGAKILELIGNVSGLDPDARDLISKITYKCDLWIGADGTLYQQNTHVAIPETTVNGQAIPALEFNSLVTYRDFNDSSINIVAPI